MLGRKPAGIGVIPEKGQEQHKTTVWMGVTSSFRRCMCGPHLGSEAGSPGEPSRDSTNGPEAGARRNKRRKRSQRSWGGLWAVSMCTGIWASWGSVGLWLLQLAGQLSPAVLHELCSAAAAPVLRAGPHCCPEEAQDQEKGHPPASGWWGQPWNHLLWAPASQVASLPALLPYDRPSSPCDSWRENSQTQNF